MRRPNPVATYNGGPVPYSEARGDYTQEQVEEGKRLLAEMADPKWAANVRGYAGRFGVVPTDNPAGNGSTGYGSCHSGLTYLSDKSRLIVTSGVRAHGVGSEIVSEDTILRWYDWLVNRSPWSDVVIEESRDAGFVSRRGVICDAAYPAAFIQGMNIAMRHRTEMDWVISNWDTLVQEFGIPENHAFVMAYCLCVKRTYGEGRRVWVAKAPGGGHQPINSFLDINNFLKADIKNLPTEEPWWNRRSYVGVCSLWGLNTDTSGGLGRLLWSFARDNPPSPRNNEESVDNGEKLADPFARASSSLSYGNAFPYVTTGWEGHKWEDCVELLVNFFKHKGLLQ